MVGSVVSSKPLLFVDVDGVLNRFVSNSKARARHLTRVHAWSDGHRWSLWLDMDDRYRLDRLSNSFELAWGTTWEDDAFEAVGRPLRLPEFNVIARRSEGEESKAPGVVRAAQGRPFIWIDDEPEAVEISAPQSHRVIVVNSATGLDDSVVDACLSTFEEWRRAGVVSSE